MSRSRYKKRKPKRSPLWWTSVISVLLVLGVLISSIYAKKDPVSLFSDVFSSSSDEEIEKIPYDTLFAQNTVLSSTVEQLEEQLAICKGEKQYKRAIVDIESNTVNMRGQASLSSNIILQIPDSSIVQILYYDTQRYILNQKYGKWCKIRYAGTEGWVWGNFIKELE